MMKIYSAVALGFFVAVSGASASDIKADATVITGLSQGSPVFVSIDGAAAKAIFDNLTEVKSTYHTAPGSDISTQSKEGNGIKCSAVMAGYQSSFTYTCQLNIQPNGEIWGSNE